MKKAMPVLIALLLILVIGGAYFGKLFMDKYSYSDERVDLDEYYDVAADERAIILQDEMVPEKVIVRDGYCYADIDTVHEYINEGFYQDSAEQILLYTTALDTVRVSFDTKEYSDKEGGATVDYTICFLRDNGDGDVLYIALDYVKKFSNFSYDEFERKVQIYTEWGERQVADVKKDSAIRERGGVKSSILRDVSQGETVEVLEQMETWSKVKTSDAYIGYIENKQLDNMRMEQEIPVTDYVADEYTSISMDGKVGLGWHAVGGVQGNDTLDSMAAEGVGMNVIAPTWFSLNDSQGGFRSFGSADYVKKAHNKGLEVWAVLDDFNYNNENGGGIDVYAVLSSTTNRNRLVDNVVGQAVSLGVDGINIDFERVSSECGEHYIQFLREMSVACRRNSLVLSVDNYVPFNFNDYYRLDIQGEVVDYVIIMGYDEHYHGSGNPGSVASIDYVSNGLDKTIAEVPAEKVINALPFYTILWKTNGAEVTDEYITLANTADFLSRVNASPEWDDVTCQNYAEWKSGESTYQIWIEDAESIAVKLNVMTAKEIGGVAVWRLGYGNSSVWELVKAYVNN